MDSHSVVCDGLFSWLKAKCWVLQVLGAVVSLSISSAALLQHLASLLVLPHCLGSSHSEAATQLGTLTDVAPPGGAAVRLAPSQRAAGKQGRFTCAASRHRPTIGNPLIATRNQICGSSCRVDGIAGGSAQQPRRYCEAVPGRQRQYRQQPLPLPAAAPLPFGRPFTVVLDLDETLVWTQRPGRSCGAWSGCAAPVGCEQPDARCVVGAFTVQCEVRLCQRKFPKRFLSPAPDRSSAIHRAENMSSKSGAFACTNAPSLQTNRSSLSLNCTALHCPGTCTIR